MTDTEAIHARAELWGHWWFNNSDFWQRPILFSLSEDKVAKSLHFTTRSYLLLLIDVKWNEPKKEINDLFYSETTREAHYLGQLTDRVCGKMTKKVKLKLAALNGITSPLGLWGENDFSFLFFKIWLVELWSD